MRKRSFKFYITLWVIKLIHLIIRILNKLKIVKSNATNFPGRVALKLCPDFMGMVEPAKTVIGVTGTNGKTTVSNMISDILADNGYNLINNRYGSNTNTGIATALMQSVNIFGKAKKDIAVLEIDERSSPRVFPYITPNYLICTNIFRDTLMRNAHTEFIANVISQNVPKETVMIENADDLICSQIAPDNSKIYFGIDRLDTDTEKSHNLVRDIVTCPKCNTKLEYEYYRYHHIGKAHCPKCDFESPNADYQITNIDFENKVFTLKTPNGQQKYRLISDNIINIYNVLTVITLLLQIGLTQQQIEKSLEKLKIVETRFSEEDVEGIRVVTQLAKGINPIACSRAFEYAKNAKGNKVAIVIVDDLHEDANGSENISWQYDTDYEFLNDKSIKQVIVAGPRYLDSKVRLLMTGINSDKLSCKQDLIEATNEMKLDGIDGVYILHDLYSIDETKMIKQRVEEMISKWKKK